MIVIFGILGILLGIAISPISKEIINYKSRRKTGENKSFEINKKILFFVAIINSIL